MGIIGVYEYFGRAVYFIITGDDILRKNADGVHLYHREILIAKFGKNRTFRFSSSARTDIHTDGRDTP